MLFAKRRKSFVSRLTLQERVDVRNLEVLASHELPTSYFDRINIKIPKRRSING